MLPHEVAGFSGGNKYLFPGVSGREFIDASHWLGALITSAGKVEPVVADGGQVVLYAPHIRQVAATHPEIERIGYHCRDYFTSD